MRTWLPLLAVLLVPSLAHAQGAKKATRITYDDHVLPFLKDKCANCHNQDKKRGGLVVNNFTSLMQGGSSGAAIKPGDPDGSLLFKAVAHTAEPFMPPREPKVGQDKIDLIQKWIAGGAPENSGSKVVIKPAVDLTLSKVTRGRPEGPPPMPPAKMPLDPVVKAARPTTITALASNPWSPLVAVGAPKQVLLYHSDRLDLLGVLPFPEGVPQVLKFSRNGSLLLAGGGHPGKSGRVVVWSVTKGERVFAIGDETDSVLAADISPDQTQIALGGPARVVRIYSTRDGKLLHEVRKHTEWITALEFSPDGVLLASGDRNGGLHVWEAFTAREFYTLRGHTAAISAVSWRLDSNVVASSSEDGTVRLWGMDNGNQIRSWGAHGGGALSVSYTHDGHLVSAGRDRVPKLWNGNGGLVRNLEALPDVSTRATFTHDGKRIVAGDWGGALVVWNAADAKRVGTLTTNPPGVKEQLARAQQEVTAREAAYKAALAKAEASKLAAVKATAALAAGQKAITDTAAALKGAQAKFTAAQDSVNRGRAALASAQSEARAKETLATALREAASKVRAAADRDLKDRALNDAWLRATTLADAAFVESASAQKTVAGLQESLKVLEPVLVVAQKEHTAAANAAGAAPKALPGLQAALKSAQAAEAADRPALEAATSALNEARAALARWQTIVAGR